MKFKGGHLASWQPRHVGAFWGGLEPPDRLKVAEFKRWIKRAPPPIRVGAWFLPIAPFLTLDNLIVFQDSAKFFKCSVIFGRFAALRFIAR